MAPYLSDAAKENLQRGIRKMQTSMTPAARVRRNFQLGRPKKSPDRDEPLHPAVVWQRANAALADFRSRMAGAKLDPSDATAFIVYVMPPNFDDPHHLALDGDSDAALSALGKPDVLALGLVFVQVDRQAGTGGQRAYFPYQFVGLSLRAQAALRRGGEQLMSAIAALDRGN